MYSSALLVPSAVLRPSYTCCEVERSGEPSLVGGFCGRRLKSDQSGRGTLVGSCLSEVDGLEAAGGVIASGKRNVPWSCFANVREDGVGLLQAYGDASLCISGRPIVSTRGPFRFSRRLARSSSLVGGVECVSGDFLVEGTHTKRRSGV
jgi:hypothetical protein